MASGKGRMDWNMLCAWVDEEGIALAIFCVEGCGDGVEGDNMILMFERELSVLL